MGCISLANTDCWQLRQQVRYATQANHPQLIQQWLRLDSCCQHHGSVGVCNHCSVTKQQNHAEQQFLLLIDVISDDLLPGHWRAQCLDMIYQPLDWLRVVADSPQSKRKLRYLQQMLFSCSHYFASSISHSFGITEQKLAGYLE